MSNAPIIRLLLAAAFLSCSQVSGAATTYTDVFSTSGFSSWTTLFPAHVVDWDEDGWDDLLFAGSAPNPPRLFRNDQDGTFTERNDLLGPMQGASIVEFCFGDIDNDGYRDVAARLDGGSVTFYMGSVSGYVENAPATLSGITFRWIGLADTDVDGDLDLVGVLGDVALTCNLYVNDQLDFSAVFLADDADRGAIGDLDGNGLVDVMVMHARPANTTWVIPTALRNDGGNGFTAMTNTGLPALPHYAPRFFDHDNDGDLDAFVGTQDWGSPSQPWLIRNDGNWTFTDVSQPSMDIGNHYYASAAIADHDRDGDLDYFTAMGASTDAKLFQNDDGTFNDASATYGIAVGGGNTGKHGVWIDIDRDHDLDLFALNHWNAVGGWLFRNDTDSGNWLEVVPQPTISNLSRYGTRVEVFWAGQSQIQHYEASLNDFPESFSKTKFFGLGATATVDSVVVHWAAGTRSTLHSVAANQVLEIQESDVLSVDDVSIVCADVVDTVRVSISLTAPAGAIDAFGFDVDHPAGLTFVAASPGSLSSGWTTFSSNALDGTKVRVGGFDPTPIAAGALGTIAYLDFAVTSPADTVNFDVCLSALVDDVAGVTTECGVVTVIDGMLDGDVDGNGEVTSVDALCAFESWLQDTVPACVDTTWWPDVADADCSATITPGDALCVFEIWLDGSCSFCAPAAERVVPALSPRSVALEHEWRREGGQWVFEVKSADTVDLTSWGLDWALEGSIDEPDQVEILGRDHLVAGWSRNDGGLRVGAVSEQSASYAAGDVLFRATWSENWASPPAMRLESGADDLVSATSRTDAIGNPGDGPVRPVHSTITASPNPFNPRTTFVVYVPEDRSTAGPVIEVHDMRGRLVRSIAAGLSSYGWSQVIWDGRDDAGREVASGVYFASLRGVADPVTVKVGVIR